MENRIMAKHTKEELAEIQKQTEILYQLLLKKTGTKEKDLIELIKQQFIRGNLDILTPTEKKRFDKLVLS